MKGAFALRLQGIRAMIMVQSIESGLRFYRDLLGFTVESEQEDIVLFAEGVGLQLAAEVSPDLRFDPNAVSLALFVEDVQAAFLELTAKGVAFFLPPTTEGGYTFAMFRDLENNLLQLMQIQE